LKKFVPELNVPAREAETLHMAQIFKIIKNKYFTYQKPCSPRSKIFPRQKELAQHHDHPTMAALFAAPVRLKFVAAELSHSHFADPLLILSRTVLCPYLR